MSDYTLKTGHRSSHELIRGLIRKHHTGGGRLVDVGPWDGALLRSLERHPSFEETIALEISTNTLRALKDTFDQIAIVDLESLDQLPRSSDIVILADVIEHTTDPSRLLSIARDALSADGRLLVSVPNVANVVIRLGLLFGRFDYTDKGILDRTHLRFFTRRSFLRQVRECELEIVEQTVSSMPIGLVLGGRIPGFLIRILENLLDRITPLIPTLLGYQFVAVCRRTSSSNPPT